MDVSDHKIQDMGVRKKKKTRLGGVIKMWFAVDCCHDTHEQYMVQLDV